MSLRLRLCLFFSAFLLFILSIVAVLVYTLTERSLVTTTEKNAEQALSFFAENNLLDALRYLPGDAYFETIVYPRTIVVLEEPDDLRNGVKMAFEDRHKNPTYEDIYKRLPPEVYEMLFTSKGAPISTRVRLDDNSTLMVMTRSGTLIEEFGNVYSAVYIVGVPMSSVQDPLNQLRSNLLLTILLALLICLISVWLLASQVLRPLRRITTAAGLVTSRDLAQRVPVPNTRDELSSLAKTINSMLERLQESFDTQRRFTADASHELRTPVTAIGGHASYLLRRTNPSDTQQESLKVIKSESERMGKLVNDLLELARADAGFTVAHEPLNLVDILEDVHLEITPIAAQAKVVVQRTSPLVEIHGDANRLKQVLLNLVHNAINAGATVVTLSLQAEKRADTPWVRLEVLDNGPGIPEEAIPYLFERFYRVDGARSTRGNGSGLGLAIVKWIVTQHNGEVEVTSRLGEGTVFTIMLPVEPIALTEPIKKQPARPALLPVTATANQS